MTPDYDVATFEKFYGARVRAECGVLGADGVASLG